MAIYQIYHLLVFKVYVDISLGPMGLVLYPHKPPPQQEVYLVYTHVQCMYVCVTYALYMSAGD